MSKTSHTLGILLLTNDNQYIRDTPIHSPHAMFPFPFLTTSNFAVAQAVIHSSSMVSDTLPSKLAPPTAVPPTPVDIKRIEAATRNDATLHHRHRHVRNPLHGWHHERDHGHSMTRGEGSKLVGTAASGVTTPERESRSGRPSGVETPREVSSPMVVSGSQRIYLLGSQQMQDRLGIFGRHPDFDAEGRRTRPVATSGPLDEDSEEGPPAQAARQVQLEIMGAARMQTKIKEQ
ncbi:hypothetical protein DFP72DRAFT_440165 [Ephemerocybe angulata]|uniref:Uncharacterized protein n=1 Tax=Ephemerocybe angulata TaxID=980116 RepID=A0A8H6M5C2_9AGAR|nr:hypothetical protein DFP72DRAFT_440165 [Tulosesus angulatus]